MAAGTLAFWCAIHRKCIGFLVLKSAESVEHVYNILLTRFKILPLVIIYDNGCNLWEYIFNRSPEYFCKSMVLCDAFHWCNHTNCFSGFDFKEYPFLNGKLTLY